MLLGGRQSLRVAASSSWAASACCWAVSACCWAASALLLGGFGLGGQHFPSG
ncbi:MAG: hypothetical protein MZW92_55045 [Comamonadaceae bacterium]|nr:hypothetical protein [Comamonadaceae bacterium]